MNMNNPYIKRAVETLISAVVSALVMLAAAYGFTVTTIEPIVNESQAEGRGSGITRFNTEVAFQNGITVANTVTASDLAATDDLTVADDATISDDLTVSGDSVLSGALSLTGALTLSANPILSSESITPTDGGTLTPVASLVTLTPAGALGTALAACTTGQRTILYNSVNASVVITDTGNFIGAGNATLTQFDTLHLVCVATKWVQLGTVPNN